jgi:stringent starvation protein B
MSEGELPERLQEILALLLAKRLELSLVQVEHELARWRAGEVGVQVAHTETLRHTARSSALGARIARAGLEGPAALLRDAYDLDLIDAAEFERLAGVPLASVPAQPPLDDEASADGKSTLRMPKKRDVVLKLLEDGPVLVHLDARKDDVEVPVQHKGDAKLVLRLGLALTPPIHDLDVAERDITATLSFRGKSFTCKIPWSAVYAVVAEDGRGLVWPEQVPPEVEDEFRRPAATTVAPPRPSRRPTVTPPGPGGPDDEKPKAGKSHLRLV